MEALIQRKDESHGGTEKYPDELRERATRMAVEARRDPVTRSRALARVAGQLGINPETLTAPACRGHMCGRQRAPSAEPYEKPQGQPLTEHRAIASPASPAVRRGIRLRELSNRCAATEEDTKVATASSRRRTLRLRRRTVRGAGRRVRGRGSPNHDYC